MPGLSCFGNIPWFFLAFGGITCCGSASLKLCVCDAAYPWSQSPSPHSQWLVDPSFLNFWNRGWHWCNDNRHWCSGVLQWCSKFRCGDKWGDSWLWFSFWFGGFFQGSWIASLGSVVLRCAPAVLCLLGLATVLPGKKKIVDEGKLKTRAPGWPKQRLKEMPIKPLVMWFRKAAPPWFLTEGNYVKEAV